MYVYSVDSPQVFYVWQSGADQELPRLKQRNWVLLNAFYYFLEF